MTRSMNHDSDANIMRALAGEGDGPLLCIDCDEPLPEGADPEYQVCDDCHRADDPSLAGDISDTDEEYDAWKDDSLEPRP